MAKSLDKLDADSTYSTIAVTLSVHSCMLWQKLKNKLKNEVEAMKQEIMMTLQQLCEKIPTLVLNKNYDMPMYWFFHRAML